jgi:hypothetical protein
MTCRRVAGAVLMLAALGSSTARADWAYTPQTPKEAAEVSSFGFFPTRLLELRLAYQDINAGGNATLLTLRLNVPMPYVLIPGLRILDWYSIVRVEVPVISLSTPLGSTVGLGDVQAIDGFVIPIRHRAAVGFAFSSMLPSATSPLLGTGKLLIGPGAGASVYVVRNLFAVGLLAEALFTVAGSPMRPSVDAVLLQPQISILLPRATYLLTNPIITINLNRGGQATVPVNLLVGHAFTTRVVMELGPEWVTAGDGRNDVLIRLNLAYLGW